MPMKGTTEGHEIAQRLENRFPVSVYRRTMIDSSRIRRRQVAGRTDNLINKLDRNGQLLEMDKTNMSLFLSLLERV